jgi:hypothetical protein
VEYKGRYYIGLEERNYAEPDNLYTHWLYVSKREILKMIFNNYLGAVF